MGERTMKVIESFAEVVIEIRDMLENTHVITELTRNVRDLKLKMSLYVIRNV